MSSCMDIDTFNGKPVIIDVLPEKEGCYTLFNEISLKWTYVHNDGQKTLPYVLRSSVKTT